MAIADRMERLKVSLQRISSCITSCLRVRYDVAGVSLVSTTVSQEASAVFLAQVLSWPFVGRQPGLQFTPLHPSVPSLGTPETVLNFDKLYSSLCA